MAGAPIGNRNNAQGRLWKAAILRALSNRARSDQVSALDDLAEKLLALCDQMDLGALKELGDRIDGKAVQSIAGPEGGPIQIEEIRRTIVDPNERA